MCGRPIRRKSFKFEVSSVKSEVLLLLQTSNFTLHPQFRNPRLAAFLPVACCLLTALSGVCAADQYALKFNGTSNRVDVGVALVSDNITMSAWVKADTPWVNDSRQVISNSYWGAAANRVGFHLSVGGNGRATSRFQTQADGVGVWSVTGTTVVAGNWHHLAYVKDGTKVAVLVNGKEEASRNDMPASIAGLAVQARIRIGCNTGNARFFPGLIDEVRIWNYARSEAEIRESMTHELRGTEEGLVGYWQLNEGQGTTTQDLAPVPHHGTIVGATWTTETAPVALAPPPAFAERPSPAGGKDDLPRDVELRWRAGCYAETHDVYLGTAFADVNTASRTDPKGVLVRQGQAETSFRPAGPLEYGTVYYWRIDEVNKAPDSTIYKGPVWSFKTEPYAYPVKPVAATASSAQPNTGPEKTIDGSGLDADDRHGTDAATTWMSAGILPNWIQYEFDQAYALHDMQVWNFNQVSAVIGFGAKTVTIEHSLDGVTWTRLANVPQFAEAPGLPGYAANTTVPLGGIVAKYVKLTIEATWSGLVVTGLSEVRFSSAPMQARAPQPAPGATGVGVDSSLDWRPGRDATSHVVYLGTDRNAVTGGTAAARTVTEHGYVPETLSLGTTYYWRVDEVGTRTFAGETWSFTTQEYVIVEDFESYTDKAGKEIYMTWLDGFDNPARNGAVVGLDVAVNGTFGDTTTFHGGKQSMPFAYDNSKAPLSETTRTFDEPQDWTGAGITTLVLFFCGDPANTATELYIKINNSRIAYAGAAGNLTRRRWNQWNIDLTGLPAATLRSVRTLTLGVTGGTGKFLFDDLRLYRVAPEIPVAVNPGAAGLVASYAMTNNVQDGSGNGHHGTVLGAPTYVAGRPGLGTALKLSGATDCVDLGNKPVFNFDGSFSLAVWAHIETWTTNWGHVMVGNRGENNIGWQLRRRDSNKICFTTRMVGTDDLGSTMDAPLGEWVHIAAVYDNAGNTKRIYVNGAEDAFVRTNPGQVPATTHNTYIGARANTGNTGQEGFFAGLLDEARIYHRALSANEVEFLSNPTP
ncbi:MAG: hypothetical protein FJ280_16010 [Planctomycetes bacterium]|nr:hypothetical protein [Planctomycetota bacterium]